MYLQIKVKLVEKTPPTKIKVDIPHGTLNDNDALNKVVRDFLKDNGVKYVWYKIESMPNFPMQYPSD